MTLSADDILFYDHLYQTAKKDGVKKIVAGGIVLNKGRKILVVKRKANENFLPNIDELPSGNLEKGETIYEGMVREIKEETNFDIEKIESYIDCFDYLSKSGKKTRQFNFVIIPKEGELILTEHQSYKWQTPQEALDNDDLTIAVKKSIHIFAFNERHSKLLP